MDNSHAVDIDKVLQNFNVTLEKGLTDEQVKTSQEKYGKNELPEEEPTSYLILILKQFDDTLVKILLAAAAISFILALLEEGEYRLQSFVEPLVIMMILIANAVVGVWQDSSAESAINSLKEYEAPEATVVRNSKIKKIQSSELVPGDIVKLASGDMVPADLRLAKIVSTTFRVNQSSLTGESASVLKSIGKLDSDIEIQGKKNVLFSGTTVTYGTAFGVVCGTGIKTEIGKVHLSLMKKKKESGDEEDEDEKTPLKIKLDEFGELLSKVIMVICILVWLINIGHFTDPVHGGLLKGAIYYFKIAVALAVAAIPEGLPAVITTCLALGTRKMAQKKCIVRSLPSVETLGCTSVICSDKTGTLTTNKMSTIRVLTIEDSNKLRSYNVEDTKFLPQKGCFSLNEKKLEKFDDASLITSSQICSLCNESSLIYNSDKKDIQISGEPTEASLLVLSEKIGLVEYPDKYKGKSESDSISVMKEYWENKTPKSAVLEFSRERKSMSVYSKSNNTFYVKGAPEELMKRSTHIQLTSGRVVKFDDEHKRLIEKELKSYTGNALRCIALAYRPNAPTDLDLSDPSKFENIETNLVFVSVCGMIDPPRKEVKEAVRKCKSAGIRIIVITGDNMDTARAICKQIGIFPEDYSNEDLDKVTITGRNFGKLSLEEKKKCIKNVNLFSRVEPSHKMEIVDLLKKQGDITAMTGDGVNDASALRESDIGIAMGSGTAVAKDACDMVLQDDNFATIVSAVEEGRAIFNNTKQFIRYLISSNIGEVVSIFLTVALGMPEALVPVQLLWVNLVTDGFPATALGFNPPEADIMEKKPRKSNESIVNGWLFIRYLIIGTYVGVATVAGYAWWQMYYSQGPQMSWYELTHFHGCVEGSKSYSCSVFKNVSPSTVSLSILVTIEMFNALNAVSEDLSIFTMYPWINPWLMVAISLSFILHFLILYVPFLATIFGVAPLGVEEWKAVVMFSFPVIIIDEILKFFSRIFLSSQKVKTE